jgi:hypothetical protein
MNLLSQRRMSEAMKVYWKLEPALSAFYRLQAPIILRGGHPWCHMKYYQWCAGGNVHGRSYESFRTFVGLTPMSYARFVLESIRMVLPRQPITS